jgi:RNA polymerase sigma-70 factor (ECF subfamily)
MSSAPAQRPTGMTDLLVEEAREGSERAFDELVTPHRRELHLHCYRMLGSFEDAEDAVQETLLRAWTRVSTYAGASTFRAWLYAIATNVCLDALRRRKARTWPTEVAKAANPHGPIHSPTDLPWLQPYPDSLFAETSVESAEDEVVRRETVELAFLAAIQHLPPRQRAVLILRDVLAWSAKEAAAALGMTPTAVNSALQRAHATLDDRAPHSWQRPRLSSTAEQAVLQRFVTAWQEADVEALASLLAEDARFVMPPIPTWFEGRANVLAFLGGRIEGFERSHIGTDWRLVPTAANGQPAFGLYMSGDGDQFIPFATGLLKIGTEGIEEVALFMRDLANFDLFSLPAAL